MFRGRPRKEDIKRKGFLQRQRRDANKKLSLVWSNTIMSFFPWTSLKLLPRQQVGDPNKDYGGQYKGLNFNHDIVLPEGIKKHGKLSIGLIYESDHKKKTHPGKTTCVMSVKHMNYLVAFKMGLQAMSRTSMYDIKTMRVTAICGAQTLEHTDACRGVTPNWVIFHSPGGELTVNMLKTTL
jgi:hypothetical protein